MSVPGKPLKLVTQTEPRYVYTPNSGMASAELRRGFPFAFEIVDGGEFVPKEGHRRFTYPANSPKWIWQRISYVPLLFNILILAIVLVIFGVGKLPEVFKALGSGVRELRDAASDAPAGEEKKQDNTSDAAPDA